MFGRDKIKLADEEITANAQTGAGMPDGDPRTEEDEDDGDSTDVANVNNIGQQLPDADEDELNASAPPSPEEIEAKVKASQVEDHTPEILSLSVVFKNDVGSTGGSGGAHERTELVAHIAGPIGTLQAEKKLTIGGRATALNIAAQLVNVANW